MATGSLTLSMPKGHAITLTWESLQSGMNTYIYWEANWSRWTSRVQLNARCYVSFNGGSPINLADYHAPNQTDTWCMGGTETIVRSIATNTGQLSIRMWYEAGTYTNYADESEYNIPFSGGSTSRTWTITTITPYGSGAQITGVTDFTDETSPTITYTYDKGTSVSEATLYIGMSFNGSTMNLPYREITNLTGSYVFNFTESDLATLYKLLANGDTASVRFYIKTTEVINGEIMHIENYFAKTFKFVNYTPVVKPTVYDTNDATIALTGNPNHLIRYMSIPYYKMDVELRKGALDVIGCYIQNGGKIEEGSLEGTFNNPTSNIFYFSATDDRGHTGTASHSLDMFWGEFINYIKLTTSIKCTPISADGKLGITLTGKYFNANFGVAQNQLQLQYAVHEIGSAWDWSTAQTITPTMTDNTTYSYAFEKDGLDYTKQYVVEVRVADLLMSYEASVTAVARPVFYWGADTFVFNVPVTANNDIIINGQSLLQILRSGGLIT